MAKKDLSPELQSLYFPGPKEPVFVDVPRMQFLMVDGAGDPNTSQDFRDAIGALYGLAYTIKFTAKKAGNPGVFVMPLELLLGGEGAANLQHPDKNRWEWTMMIMMPPSVKRALFEECVGELRERKNPPALSKVRLESFDEGKAAQVLHVGPYAAEGPTIERLHAFIRGNGYRLSGKHHEIYLGDPNRSAPEKLKTVVRQPVSP